MLFVKSIPSPVSLQAHFVVEFPRRWSRIKVVIFRYLRLALALFRYSLTRELMFKANFLLWIVVEFAWFAIQLTLVEVIYSHVQEVAGWSKYEMIVLIGTSHLVQQLFQVLFMVNCIELPDHVRTGRLDFLLVQPANSQFLVSVRKFDIGALVNMTIALGFVIYALGKLGIQPTWIQVLFYFLLVINGTLIHYALMLGIVTFSFWIVRAQGLVYGYYNLFHLTRIPKEAFQGGMRLFFTYALPMLLVANYPAEVLARNFVGWGMVGIVGITLAFLLVGSLWFRFGLRFYTSASS